MLSALESYRNEHRTRYAEPRDEREKSLFDALAYLEQRAFELITKHQIPEELVSGLSDFMPGEEIDDKLHELLSYNYAHENLELDVATAVVRQLASLPYRIAATTVAFMALCKAEPSPTAAKYLERASTLFLAGYSAETIIMCGAAIEAAIAARISDETLRSEGLRPAFARAGTYSLGQRMYYEKDHSIMTPDQRERFWKVVNWRNDAVHLRPDVEHEPRTALFLTAYLLGVILPKESSTEFV